MIGPQLAALFFVSWQLLAETMIEYDADLLRAQKNQVLDKFRRR